MPQYIKSHSNYVLKSKHQDVSSGTIWERDATTIGGLDQYAKGQIPIYKSSNFVITINSGNNYSRDISRTKWATNENSGEIWTLAALEGVSSETESDNDLVIVPKLDYYDLRDFAYYGSCSELIRGSINNIIANFPGEMYCPLFEDNGGIVQYTYKGEGTKQYAFSIPLGKTFLRWDVNGDKDIFCRVINDVEMYPLLSGDTLYLLSNPFLIDIYTKNISLEEYNKNPLKYFCNGGYKNYEVVCDDGSIETIKNCYTVVKSECLDAGVLLSEVQLITNKHVYHIYVYCGDYNQIYYLVNESNLTRLKNKHIRPKSSFFTSFYNGLSMFEKILLNLDTTPKYQATFQIIHENDFGYYTTLETFEFPKDSGGYNISTAQEYYSDYIKRLVAVGEFYDERFSDNLWRSMTHEAIKNFDWSYKRVYEDGDDYTAGGNKIQKALRLFAREFDETKIYIDSIQNTTLVSYNEKNNIPDYFLTDILENDGWDLKLVYPLSLSGTNHYSQIVNLVITPYSSENLGVAANGYFPSSYCDCSGTTEIDPSEKPWEETAPTSHVKYDECKHQLVNLVRPYSSEKEYTMADVNTEFMKRLKINSKPILRHKGTIEGVEMMLALFGLKSKRWAGENSNYDFEIKEYTSFIDAPIKETWDNLHDEYRINWINGTKLIDYNYSNSNVTNVAYQGLPVSYRDIEGSTLATDYEGNNIEERYLFPYFNSSEQLDGDPYYQMNGGWERKCILDESGDIYFQFDTDDNFVSGSPLFHETLRNIRSVDSVSELLSSVKNTLHDHIVYYVSTVETNIAVVDGSVYYIENDDTTLDDNCLGFINMTVYASAIKIGDRYFDDSITTYDVSGNPHDYDLTTLADGYVIRGYIWDNKTKKFMAQKSDNESISSFHLLTNGDEDTNYFVLQDTDYANYISFDNENEGWQRLKTTDQIYKDICTISDYFKGNNPHNGNQAYDAGIGYLENYEELFNYALDNDLFDSRCYGKYYYTALDEIKAYGFKVSDASTNLKVDSKVHFFGNYRDEAHNGSQVYLYTDNLDKNESGKTYSDLMAYFYSGSNVTSLQTYSINGVGAPFGGYSAYTPVSGAVMETTNQIVNNKYLTITFHIPTMADESENMCILKYYDSVIIPYVEQMIPSTSILNIEYVKYTVG